LVIKCIR